MDRPMERGTRAKIPSADRCRVGAKDLPIDSVRIRCSVDLSLLAARRLEDDFAGVVSQNAVSAAPGESQRPAPPGLAGVFGGVA
jgi:hypothetical protein